jgi:hypothetical protein
MQFKPLSSSSAIAAMQFVIGNAEMDLMSQQVCGSGVAGVAWAVAAIALTVVTPASQQTVLIFLI